MADLWNNLKKGIRDGISTVSSKTDEITRIGRLKIELIAVKRDIEKAFIELGGTVYEYTRKKQKPDIYKDEQVAAVVARIKEFEKNPIPFDRKNPTTGNGIFSSFYKKTDSVSSF